MRRIHDMLAVMLVTAFSLLASCTKVDTENSFANTSAGNFAALWTIMDEHYCFFDYKNSEFGLDWDQVYDRYQEYVYEGMGDMALFEVLSSMLSELRDGHVNLYGPYDVSRNWSWKEDYPANYSEEVRDGYLGTDYKIASTGYFYQVLPDNIGYMTIESFSNAISDSKLDAMLHYLCFCNGLIIDIRNNGGGNLDIAEQVASRFTNEKVLTGYTKYKNGPGHNDFSAPVANYVEPAMSNLRWQKPVALLTNRGCFSSANDFTVKMKEMPMVTVFGDRTGGGGGLPMSSELPNGWSVRFSSAPSYDKDMNDIEGGVDPDVFVSMTDSDRLQGIDTIIEAAREWINGLITN